MPNDIIQLRFNRSQTPDKGFDAQVIQASKTTFNGPLLVDTKQQHSLDQLFQQMSDFSTLTPCSDSGYQGQPCAPKVNRFHQDMTELGQGLWDILPYSISQNLPHLLQAAEVEDRGVQLIIEAHVEDYATHLLGLPWELLFLPESGRFPASGPNLQIIRRVLGLPRQANPPLPSRFSLLHHIALQGEHPETRQAIAAETRILPALLGTQRYTRVTSPGSVHALTTTLATQAFDVFHFLGHGDLCFFTDSQTSSQDENPGQGFLWLFDGHGEKQYLTAEHLKILFAANHSVKLVVLPACQSASRSAHSIALNLVQAGFPNVIAMQGDLPQRALPHFTQALYQALDEHQDIPRAVATARHQIASLVPDTADWCMPVLYTNEGLAETTTIQRWADQLIDKVTNSHYLQHLFWKLTAVHLLVAMALGLSGVQQPLPDWEILGYAIAWTGLCTPIIILIMQWRSRQQLLKASPNHSKLSLFCWLYATSIIGQGLLMLITICVVALLAGLGFWQDITPLAQLLILQPIAGLSLFLAYAQARANTIYFINNERMPSKNRDHWHIMIILLGYLGLATPWFINTETTSQDIFLGGPPLTNLSMALYCAVLATLLHYSQQTGSRQPSQ